MAIDYKIYTDEGFRIFSLQKVIDGDCECENPECQALYKHPRMRSWQHAPHWSQEQLDNMVKYGQFDSGMGVIVDDHLIIDIDPRNGGDVSFEKLCKDTGLDYKFLSGFVVKTGGGGHHIYFTRAKADALAGKLDDYPGIDFKSSGFVVSAGSMHLSGTRYSIESGSPAQIMDAPHQLLELLRKRDKVRSEFDGQHVDLAGKDIKEMLSFVSADCCYDEWIKIGMSVHEGTNGTGYDLWAEWSGTGKEPSTNRQMTIHWDSFGANGNPITIGTLLFYAEEGGYKEPVDFSCDIDYVSVNKESVDDIDLTRPPGFVGEVVQWINAQSRYPREHLAVGAALSAIGNIAGLSYTDKHYKATANQFIFCVAASATGKESIQQSQMYIQRVAGLGRCSYGGIKSEQEIVRNLLEHQAAFYIVDEMGILLQKISNAKGGGAAYLEGVIGLLMSAYSKANALLPLVGDVKRDARNQLMKDMQRINGYLEDSDDVEPLEREIESLKTRIASLAEGIERPFLSLIGFTTPVTFDNLVTHETATNGFFGRSLIIQEKETNPEGRAEMEDAPMSMSMRMTLCAISKLPIDSDSFRIEEPEQKVIIPTAPDARKLLLFLFKDFHTLAEDSKDTTLEALPRRGFEQVLKISLVLAIPSGLRTVEHVNWANALVRRDIDQKINLAAGNMALSNKSLDEALGRKIVGILGKDVGVNEGTIINRCPKFKRTDVSKMLERLKELGKIKGILNQKGRVKTVKWFLA